MRFLCDENVARSVFVYLQKSGHDTTHVADVASGVPDEEVLRRAFNEDRIILTHNRDFGNALRVPFHQHAGIILMRLRSVRPDFIIQRLEQFLIHHGEADLRGRLVVLGAKNNRFYAQ